MKLGPRHTVEAGGHIRFKDVFGLAHRNSRAAGRVWGLDRRIAAAGLALLLAACGGGEHNREPFADSRVPPSLGAPYLPPDAWAWGYIQVGDAPVQRYGVSSPPVRPKAQVIILPSYGESAEGWFETVRDLNGRGFNVWVLEATGQGGSGRYLNRRDVGHARNLAVEAEAVRALINVVVRPGATDPVVVLASGTAAPIGLAAAALPRSPITGLILSGPQTLAPAAPTILPALPTSLAPGQAAWSRPDLTALPPRRAAAASWAIANPDLRMGGYTRGYQAAWGAAADNAMQPAALRRIRASVWVIAPEARPIGQACSRMARCVARRLAGQLPYHHAADQARTSWLDEVTTAIRPPAHGG